MLLKRAIATWSDKVHTWLGSVKMAPEKDWPALASGAAAVGREDAGEELVVIGVAGDDVTGADTVGEEVTAETAGLAAGDV